jgi:hypothetical protein
MDTQGMAAHPVVYMVVSIVRQGLFAALMAFGAWRMSTPARDTTWIIISEPLAILYAVQQAVLLQWFLPSDKSVYGRVVPVLVSLVAIGAILGSRVLSTPAAATVRNDIVTSTYTYSDIC